MGKNSAQLNSNQIAVLGWIRDGCPDSVYTDGYEHRIIARSLERRGFVSISGRGRTWTATITDAGRQFNDAPPGGVVPDESEADRLIASVIEAGQVVLPEDREVVKAHELLVQMSLKSPLRPRGKKLEMVSTGRWGSGPKSIVFTEHFDDLVEAQPVPVPERITRYHPAVKAFVHRG